MTNLVFLHIQFLSTSIVPLIKLVSTMSEDNIKLEKTLKEQDPAYHIVLQDYRKHCQTVM